MSTLVYGGSLAALVAAERMADAGHAVNLVTPTAHVGGHFAGARVGGARLDAGLVIFEFGALNSGGAPDPVSYQADVRNDCGRFGEVLAAYVEQLGITLERVPGFHLWTDAGCIPDFVFDTRLDGLRRLPPWQREHVREELRRIVASGEHPLHARRKYREPRFGSLSYDEASLANHGPSLHHSCFEPFARKVTGHSSSEILALYSRAAWLPLFWPETLLAALEGDAVTLPEMPFHVARGGAVADLVDALRRRLDASPRITRIVGRARALVPAGRGIRLETETHALHATQLVWGHDLEALLALTTGDTPPSVTRAPVTLVLAQVPRRDVETPELGTVILPSDHALPYRITNQSTNAGVPDEPLVRISVEWGGADAPTDDDALLALTQAALARVGMTTLDAGFASHQVLRIERALVLPSAANRDAILGMRQRVNAMGLPIQMIAPAAGFAVASLNDHLVQGMKAARLAGDAAIDEAATDAAPALATAAA